MEITGLSIQMNYCGFALICPLIDLPPDCLTKGKSALVILLCRMAADSLHYTESGHTVHLTK